MNDLYTTNHHGAIVDLRSRKMWRWLDFLGLGKRQRYDFEYEIALAIQTYSRARVEVAGKELKVSSELYDFYGLGTSANEVLVDYVEGFNQDFGDANVDIVVTTRVEIQPCLFATDEPFYAGSVKITHIPRHWVFVEDNLGEFALDRTDFVVWKNGEPTEDAAFLKDYLRKCAEGDIASKYRNGDLKCAKADSLLGC